LKEFNCKDLDKLDLNGESDEEKEEGEMDVSVPGEITNEVSVSKKGQDKTGSSNAPAVQQQKTNQI